MFRCARKASIAVRSSVIWIDLIGVSPACSGSLVKVGGPLCGADAMLGAWASPPAPRSAAGESERDSEPSLTVGLVLRADSTRLFFASRSVGKSTLGSDGLESDFEL